MTTSRPVRIGVSTLKNLDQVIKEIEEKTGMKADYSQAIDYLYNDKKKKK